MFIKRLLFITALLAVAACTSTLTDPKNGFIRPDSTVHRPPQ
jgi:hypothetical protein